MWEVLRIFTPPPPKKEKNIIYNLYLPQKNANVNPLSAKHEYGRLWSVLSPGLIIATENKIIV